jgi:Zn-dependent protease with chaperone function
MSTSESSLISGRYFDGRSAAGIDATLEFAAGLARMDGGAAPIVAPIVAPLDGIRVSDRVANIPRRVMFPDGGVFETSDNDAIDRACDASGIRRGGAVVHWLESRWPVAVGALLGVAFLSFAFFQWGVPAIASRVAAVVPASVDNALGSGTLQILDRMAFRESELSPDRQAELQTLFFGMTQTLDQDHNYRLELRHGGAIGPNAFALPSGIVVMTDELVELSRSDQELTAVLAHELGHVKSRHALRQLLQAAGVSSLAVALLGDVSSISGLLSAAPALLQAKHSRAFEREADVFAKKWLREKGIPESRFDAILCRISGSNPKQKHRFDFFASHPATSERARCAKVN